MTVVLTSDPFLFFLNNFWTSNFIMSRVCKGFAVKPPNKQIVVRPATMLSRGDIARSAADLDEKLHNVDDEEVIGFGYSRGAQVISEWLREYAPVSYIDPGKTRFILIGNPERDPKFGGRPGSRYLDGTPFRITPTNTRFRVRDIARFGDHYADAPNASGLKGRLAHTGYWNIDLNNPTIVSAKHEGNTDYLVVE